MLQICVAVIAIFIPIYYTLLLDLIDRSEDAFRRATRVRKESDLMEYYQPICDFVNISGEYFQLIGIIFLAQVIKIVAKALIQNNYLNEVFLIINFFSLWFIYSFFKVIRKAKSSNVELIFIIFLFYLTPTLLWCITFKLDKPLVDLSASFGLLIISLLYWFAHYPVKYKPFTNLRRLKGISIGNKTNN